MMASLLVKKNFPEHSFENQANDWNISQYYLLNLMTLFPICYPENIGILYVPTKFFLIG